MLAYLADTADGTIPSLGPYGTLGVAGVFVAALFYVGWRWIQDLIGQRDRAYAEVGRLNAAIIDTHGPAQAAALNAVREAHAALLEQRAELAAERRRH